MIAGFGERLHIPFKRRLERLVLIPLTMQPRPSRDEYESQLGVYRMFNHMGEIQDIMDAVLYLESATFLTGEVLHVDGGQHAGHW